MSETEPRPSWRCTNPDCYRDPAQDGECWLCPDCKRKLDDRIALLERLLDEAVPGWRKAIDPKPLCPKCGAAMPPVDKTLAIVLKTHGIDNAYQCPKCGHQPFYGPEGPDYLDTE